MIKPMVVDLEVDPTCSDGLYYYCFFYSLKELGFTKSYLQFSEKSYNRVWDLRTFAQVSGKWNVSRVVTRLYGMNGYIKCLRPLPLLVINFGLPSGVLQLGRFPISAYNCGFATRCPGSDPMSSQFSISHMSSFIYPTIYPRRIAEPLVTIRQRPKKNDCSHHLLNTLYIILLYIFLIVFCLHWIYYYNIPAQRNLLLWDL